MKLFVKGLLVILMFASIIGLPISCQKTFGIESILESNINTQNTNDYNFLHEEILCQYPSCNNEAEKTITFKAFSSVDGYKEVLGFANSADFNVRSDSFSYTPTKTQTHYDKGTYLVPQKDGSYKLENRTYKYEYETKGKTTHTSYVEISGDYCKEHYSEALSSLKSDIMNVIVFQRPIFWIFMVAIPSLTVILGIIYFATNKG